MAEGATRTRRVLLVGSSLTYYNGGIDAIVLQLTKETGGGGGICAQAASALLKRKQSRTGRAVCEQAKADKRRPTGE
jgi:hypothetical protein